VIGLRGMTDTTVIKVEALTKVFRTYRKEEGLLGAVRGLFYRSHTETKAADAVALR